MVSEPWFKSFKEYVNSVLILVLVEDGLREHKDGTQKYFGVSVLILVLVEDGLRAVKLDNGKRVVKKS